MPLLFLATLLPLRGKCPEQSEGSYSRCHAVGWLRSTLSLESLFCSEVTFEVNRIEVTPFEVNEGFYAH
jgi:hypothetical protein